MNRRHIWNYKKFKNRWRHIYTQIKNIKAIRVFSSYIMILNANSWRFSPEFVGKQDINLLQNLFIQKAVSCAEIRWHYEQSLCKFNDSIIGTKRSIVLGMNRL